MLKIEIKKAIGTSLAIIALNSLTGFINDLQRLEINWLFLLAVTFVAVVGSIWGENLSRKMEAKRLKVIFGWFVIGLGLLIIGNKCHDLFNAQ